MKNIKNIMGCLWLIAILLPTFSFAQKVAVDAKEGEITIKGEIGNINPPYQLWIYIGNTSVWDTIPIRDGAFEFKKKTLLPAYGALMIKYKPYYEGVEGYNNFFGDMDLKSLFFEAGTMKINSPVDSLKHHVVISGSSIQQQQEQWLEKRRSVTREEKEVAAVFNEATPEQLQSDAFLQAYQRKMAIVQERSDSLMRDQIKTYPNSLVSQIAFFDYLRVNKDNLTFEKAASLFHSFSERIRNSAIGKNMQLALEELRKPTERPLNPKRSITDSRQGSEPKKDSSSVSLADRPSGNLKKALPFELKDTLGYTHRLEDFKGKTVVMDFWFTGCKGCTQVARMLRDQVKPVFAGDTSVVFIAVSLDINFLQWKRSIRGGLYTSEGQLNLFTNGMGGGHPIYRYYGFSGAPQMLVIDPKGYVISSSVTLDGSALVKLIKQSKHLI